MLLASLQRVAGLLEEGQQGVTELFEEPMAVADDKV